MTLPAQMPIPILAVSLALSFGVFLMAYRWLLKPALPHLNPTMVLMPILLLHSLRHLGVMFISPGAVNPGMPWQFAWPAAAGDVLSALLAMTAATLLQRKSPHALLAVAIFNVVGSLDFVLAITLARVFQSAEYLGAAYWIPVFWVPLLAVGHLVIFDVLRMLAKKKRTMFMQESAA
jgi:hypothetical protein